MSDDPAKDTDIEQLLADVRTGLENGTIEPEAIENILHRKPKGENLSTILLAVGICIAYAGTALLYAVNFTDMPHLVDGQDRVGRLFHRRIIFEFDAPAAGQAADLVVGEIGSREHGDHAGR